MKLEDIKRSWLTPEQVNKKRMEEREAINTILKSKIEECWYYIMEYSKFRSLSTSWEMYLDYHYMFFEEFIDKYWHLWAKIHTELTGNE